MTSPSKITVIGPADGLYYLGYMAGEKFFVIQPFVDVDLAQLTAYRMNQERES